MTACSRTAAVKRGLCEPHRNRWLAAVKQDPATDFDRWLLIEEPVNADHIVIFKGLPEQVQLELLLGLQLRAGAGVRTLVAALRPVVAVLRRTQAATIDDLDESLIKQTRHDASLLARHLAGAVQRATTTPGEEQRKAAATSPASPAGRRTGSAPARSLSTCGWRTAGRSAGSWPTSGPWA